MALTAANASRFSDVAAASPETLGLVMLQADPHAWRLDRSTQFAAVSDALADGIAAARNLRTRFTDLSPEQIARELGLPVETDGRRSHGRIDLAVCRIPAAAAAHCALQPRAGPARTQRSPAPAPRNCSAGQRHETSLSPTNYTITSKPFDRTCRSRAATSLPCFELATGTGAPASRRWPRSPPAPLRSRCSTCPATRRRWTSLPWMLSP